MIELIVKCPKCKRERRYISYQASSVDEVYNRRIMCFICGHDKKIKLVPENIVKVVRLVKYRHG